MTRMRSEATTALKARFGEAVTMAAAVRQQHAEGVTFHRTKAPDAVLFAASARDVADAVSICAEHQCPIIPFGTGTSTEGQISAEQGGLTLNLSRMDRILDVSAADMDCRVEAGVTRKALNATLRDSGLFFPVDPGADASIGGMASTRASGTNAVRYGTMRDAVMSLQVVLADGRIIETGTRARKSAAGYDLTRLFVGAEGTLGVITEITLRLVPIPEQIRAAVVSVPTVSQAVETVIAAIQSGIPLARAELLDALQVQACNKYSKLDLPELPTLFLEFHGSPAGVAEQSESFGAIVKEQGGGDYRWASAPEERTRLWQARHDLWWAALAQRPGCKGVPTDICVPISALPEAIAKAQRDAAELHLIAPVCGHVGDGNFHLCILVDPTDRDEAARVAELNRRLVEHAHAVGGTCTGEHGIGIGKIAYLERERGEGVATLVAIKRALDPHNIMNPGKVLSTRLLHNGH